MLDLDGGTESQHDIVLALTTAMEQRDSLPKGHGQRVGSYAKALAERVGLTRAEVLGAYRGGLLHDIGLLGLPDGVLSKAGPLTACEFEVVMEHPLNGWEVCRHLKSLGSVALACIRHHHERLDGSGYPDGLQGSEIHVAAQVVAVANVYDALATARPYKPAFPVKTCFGILREEAARGWWSTDLVEALIEMLSDQDLGPGGEGSAGVLSPL